MASLTMSSLYLKWIERLPGLWEVIGSNSLSHVHDMLINSLSHLLFPSPNLPSEYKPLSWNCPQIQKKKKQFSNIFFLFAEELLPVPSECRQKVSQFMAVCVVHSSLFTLGLDFFGP